MTTWHSCTERSCGSNGNEAGDRADIRDEFSSMFPWISSGAKHPDAIEWSHDSDYGYNNDDDFMLRQQSGTVFIPVNRYAP